MQIDSKDGRELNILHIEDCQHDAELVRIELKRRGLPCNITQVTTPDQFERVVENQTFDLVISDSQLGSFDTLKALTFMRQRHPATPFLFLSGNENPTLKEQALAHGAIDYFLKDNLSPLVQIVKQVQEKKSPVLKKLPAIRQRVIVQCSGFRCLGFIDNDGKWKDALRSDPLPEVTDWTEI